MELQQLNHYSELSVGDTIQDNQSNLASIFKVINIDNTKDNLVLDFNGGWRPEYIKEDDGYYYFTVQSSFPWYKHTTQ
jgi:hypothetical protein